MRDQENVLLVKENGSFPKKSYARPKLTDFGSVREMTLFGSVDKRECGREWGVRCDRA